MLRLVPFQREHLDRFVPGLYDRAAMANGTLPLEAWEGRAVSAIDDAGTVLGIGGTSLVGDGVPEVWLLLSDELRARPFTLHRVALRCFWAVRDHFKLQHVQATIVPGFDTARRWAERLGFHMTERTPERWRLEWRSL